MNRGAVAGARRRVLAAAAATGLAALAPSAAAPAAGTPTPGAPAAGDALLERIFADLARDAGRERRFVERRRSVLFVEPVESRGTLRFVPPSTFEKTTESPPAERLRIDRDRATVQRGDAAAASVPLDAHPALRVVADALRGALGGDLRGLRAVFVASLRGDAAAWRLELVPRDAAAARAIERIVLAGGAGRLERIDVLERSGDATELWLLARDGRG